MDTTAKTGSDPVLMEQIQAQNGIKKKGILLAAAGGVTLILGALLSSADGVSGVILILVAVLILIAGFLKIQQANNALKQMLSEQLLPPVLDEIFDSWEHSPFDRIPDQILNHVDLALPAYDSVTGSDYIRGIYRGLNVEMSDIRLVKEEIRTEWLTDDDGNSYTEERKEETVVFTGQYLICDFHKPLAADLLLTEGRGRNFFRKPANQLETENVHFNSRFDIRSNDGHTAFYVLTPHMMEYILAMDEKAQGHTRMRFASEGRLYIAIDTGRDCFETKKVKTVEDLEQVRAAYRADTRYFTDLIDALLQNKTLFAQ